MPLILLVFAGLFILGGWIISSFNQFASSVTSPTQMHFTEVTIRSGEPDKSIAVIDLTGVITSYGPSDMVVNFKKQLELAGKDSRVKAVIIRIDSPGGEVMASDEIARAIREFEQDETIDKPIIASMGGMAASGGYYIAAPCRLIFANKLTITGSIGVIMQSVNFHGLMDKVGVKPVTFKSGPNKDMLSVFNPPEAVTQEQKEILQGFIDETYQIFVDVVSEGRAKDKARAAVELKSDIRELVDGWRDFADGRILTGKDAYEYGMVDKLGNFDDAVKFTEQYLGIEEGKARLIRNEPPMSFGNLFSLLGQAKENSVPTTIKVDIGLDMPQLRPGVPYYLSSHLYSQ
jgi:protease-4